eukprot:COSAG05_NODE_301_length_11860_cov_30.927812_9_plen_222_part_00
MPSEGGKYSHDPSKAPRRLQLYAGPPGFTYTRHSVMSVRSCHRSDHRPEGGTFKDMDLNDKLYLPIAFLGKLRETLRKDTEFLAGCHIMDYSLLLGVCKQPYINRERGGVERPLSGSSRRSSCGEGGADGDDCESSPAPFFRVDDGGLAAAVIEGPGAYHLGLIDILQVYDASKKIERCWKVYARRKDPEGISAIEPMAYLTYVVSSPRQLCTRSVIWIKS